MAIETAPLDRVAPASPPADSAAGAVEAARRQLDAARAALDAEIRDYPTPISGCDAQFTHLLAERRRVQAALRALEAAIHIPTSRAP